MKNFTLPFLLAMLACAPLYAQVSLGLRGGYNLCAMEISGPAASANKGIGSSNQLRSWHADLLLNVPLGGCLHLQPAVRYITKGANLNRPPGIKGVYTQTSSRLQLRYLELPVNLACKLPLGFGKLVIGAGPYLAYGFNGKYNFDIRYNNDIVKSSASELQFNRKGNPVLPGMQLRRWDAGANVMLGAELDNLLMLGINYSHGLLNQDGSGQYTIRNSYLGFSLGILMNREDY